MAKSRKNRRPQRRESYFKYLKSPHWKMMRKAALQTYKACVICSATKKLQVHHRNYKHLYDEIITEDLIVLCKDCHSLYHGIDIPIVDKPKKKEKQFDNEYNKHSVGAAVVEAYRKKYKQRRN
jgi:5-methylcytosine-specific restriction endonuclease McrA